MIITRSSLGYFKLTLGKQYFIPVYLARRLKLPHPDIPLRWRGREVARVFSV